MKPHRLVTRMLVQDQLNRILLVRNPERDFWYPPGGGVEVGETLSEAATREVTEETGVKAQVERLLFVQEFSNSRSGEYSVVFIFLGVLEGIDGRSAEKDYRWFEQDEVINNLSIFPRQLRQIGLGGMMQASHNPYLGLERG